MTLDAPPATAIPAGPSTMRRDLITAYFASGSKIFSWAVVTAVVVRFGREENLAVLTLVRSTVGLLTFTTLGFAPAMIRMIAEAGRVRRATSSSSDHPLPTGVLEYASPRQPAKELDPATTVYANGLMLATLLAIGGALLLGVYVSHYGSLHRTPEIPRLWVIQHFVWLMGGGVLLRLLSDAPGAQLQAKGFIWLDNLLLAGAELLWAGMTCWIGRDGSYNTSQSIVVPGGTFFVTGIVLLAARLIAASLCDGQWGYHPSILRWRIMRSLLGFGVLVALAQTADFLYAPVDYILINRLLDPNLGTIYAPAVQIDAALLVLVTALAGVLLPKTAVAHANGDIATVRRYYVRGTLGSLAILLPAAGLVLALSPWIFEWWLGSENFPTRAILPLVLIHTVVGGSSAVGRSILLGMGKVKPFTIAVLIAGVSNVILSYVFVRYFHLGLNGIIYGTIVAVVGRCAVWQPWYVMKILRAEDQRQKAESRGQK